MRDLKAKTSFSYGTRRLHAGDYLTARTTADANVLVALGKAERDDGNRVDLNPDNAPVTGAADPMKKLRADYQEVLKKKPFAGWDATELQRRIDEALR